MVGNIRFREANTVASNDPELTDPRAYRRLAAMIRQDIRGGRLKPGQPTPTITRLSREHGHARQTSSRALRALEREGLVARFPGLGYYVS